MGKVGKPRECLAKRIKGYRTTLQLSEKWWKLLLAKKKTVEGRPLGGHHDSMLRGVKANDIIGMLNGMAYRLDRSGVEAGKARLARVRTVRRYPADKKTLPCKGMP